MKIFIETQKFNQPLVYIGLAIALLITTIAFFQNWNIINNGTFASLLGSISGFLIIALVFLLFVLLKLKTRIDEQGIYYQFYPFHFTKKLIPWNKISNCFIREYNAISEFGGWGIKFGFFKRKTKCYTTKGSIGLQIELTSGNSILIGTQQKEMLQKALNNYKHKLTTHEA